MVYALTQQVKYLDVGYSANAVSAGHGVLLMFLPLPPTLSPDAAGGEGA